MKYKKGQHVQIIENNCGHRFSIGDIVKIIYVGESDYLAENINNKEKWWVVDRELKEIVVNKQINNMKKTIKQVADALLKANNTVTTLEIKTELRKRYPNQSWNQNSISNIMDDFHREGKYTFKDNGTYRVYSLVGTKANISTVNKTTPTVTTPTVTTSSKRAASKRISRTKALEIIQNTNGRFFGVTFTKKDGTQRSMSCKINKDNKPTPFGYILVQTKESPKSLNLQTISEIRANKTLYKVA
jgi:predicted metalloenzyme YecM